jgi:lipid-A-disaccharide synthase
MKSNSSCLIIAGERSGEDHALSFFKELKEKCPETEFYGVGGKRLEEHGVELIYNLKDFSGIGISEVLSKIPFYYKALADILKQVEKRKTKTAILIDFQGFNLKLAKKLKKRGVNVLYYVAPQAWVWKEYRAKVLEKCVHTLFTIIPFEKEWFKNKGVTRVKGVEHPLLRNYKDELKNIPQKDYDKNKKRILLLPGSRRVEIATLLEVFNESLKLVAEKGHDFEVGIVKVDSVDQSLYANIPNLKEEWDSNDLAQALYWADLCVAASGTVTLATGLFEVPTVVAYKLSLVTEFILGFFLKYDGPISLTNIVHEEMLFPEFTQHNANRYNISKSLLKWLEDDDFYQETVEKLKHTKDKLQGEDFSLPDYMADVINLK